MLRDLPVLGICGQSGSGKTTLIERLVPALSSRGLSVAVAKRGARHLDADRQGKDSDRLFRAGADVFVEARDEALARTRPTGPPAEAATLAGLARAYDLVLLEGGKGIDCDRVRLLGPDEREAPPDGNGTLAVLPFGADRAAAVLEILETWLPPRWRRPPVWGCILIGGRSRRMGRPKHLLPRDGKTWLEHTAACLEGVAERVVVAGRGTVPAGAAHLARLPDVPDAEGPLAGILACMRWAPRVTWLVAACDLPNLGAEAMEWLLSTRRPGTWAALPRRGPGAPLEPLLAHYDFRAREVLENAAAGGRYEPAAAAEHAKVATPDIPPHLADAWANVNTGADLARLRSHRAARGRQGGTGTTGGHGEVRIQR